jgi:hypothetical protein
MAYVGLIGGCVILLASGDLLVRGAQLLGCDAHQRIADEMGRFA